jgi:hypothetical protein
MPLLLNIELVVIKKVRIQNLAYSSKKALLKQKHPCHVYPFAQQGREHAHQKGTAAMPYRLIMMLRPVYILLLAGILSPQSAGHEVFFGLFTKASLVL